ncbi:helix-turn-helix domain-containing protein [Pseudoalteromonas sp. 120-MNA-CIBAN-0494]|uniref:helix-turn-helix domain-containing protein n=1 Tax=unclassified Pseudoalteromonas TaxID=194690 RepID=UPI00331BDA3E
MRHYKQLTYAQRCQIAVLKKSGFTQQSIAELTNLSQSTISESFLEIQVSEVTDTNKLMSGLCFAEEV